MQLHRLDHVNIRTSRLPELVAFYVDLLGLRSGPRPPFGNVGAWLYCGEHPVVHLNQAADVRDGDGDGDGDGEPRISHFAFAASGLSELLERLRRGGIPHRIGVVPGSGVQQVNLRDPDGNALHVDFAPDEPR